MNNANDGSEVKSVDISDVIEFKNVNDENKIGKQVNKKKVNIKLIIFIFIIVLGAALAAIFIPKLLNSSYGNKILVYKNTDNDLKYVSNKSDAPILLAKSYEEKIKVKYNEEKTRIAYVKNGGLYLNNINSKQDSIKIGVDVYKFEFINNKEIIYLDVNKNLYISSTIETKEKIDIDVSGIISKKNNFLVYNKGEEIYFYNIKTKEKSSILKDYNKDKKLHFSSDFKQVIYVSVDNELKIYNIESKELVTRATDVDNIINYSDDFSNIIFTTVGNKKKYYDLFINDNPIDNPIKKAQCTIYDFNTTIWNWDDGRTKRSDTKNNIYYIYSYYGVMTYLDEEGEIRNVTKEIYDNCNGADPSAELKNQIKKDETSLQLYNVYLLDNDNKVELATDVYNIMTSNDRMVVFTKFNLSKDKKIRISSLSSIDDFQNVIEKVKPNLYYANKDKKDELLTNNFDIKYKNNIDIVNNNIYFYEMSDNDELSLYEYNIEDNNKETISNKGFILDASVKDYDILYLDNFNMDTFKGDLIGRKNGKNKNIDIDVYNSLNSDNNNLYYYKDFNSKTLTGSYVINNINNNKKKIINDVSVVFNNSNNKYFVFKDYSLTSKTFSLFVYEKNKYKTVEYNVVDYKYSN